MFYLSNREPENENLALHSRYHFSGSDAAQLVPLVTACGPVTTDPVYVSKESPDPPFQEFTNGKIGIVKESFGRKTLFIAYRYLNGGSFRPDEQNDLVAALKGTGNDTGGSRSSQDVDGGEG